MESNRNVIVVVVNGKQKKSDGGIGKKTIEIWKSKKVYGYVKNRVSC